MTERFLRNAGVKFNAIRSGANAQIVRPLESMEYGSRESVQTTPEGTRSQFGTYRP
jgi:ClpP class serine protease